MPKTAGKTRVTALYERLSGDDGLVGGSNSITNQKKYLEDFAHRNGLTNIRHFTKDLSRNNSCILLAQISMRFVVVSQQCLTMDIPA